jgi:hypothetical protein
MGEKMDWSRWDILRHSIGLVGKSFRRPLAWWLDDDNHRNHFAADPCGTDAPDLEVLVSLGFMERGRPIPGGLVYFHVTEAGIRAVLEEYGATKGRFNREGARP